VLGGGGSGQGGYVDLDGDGRWWIPGGRVFFSPDGAHSAGQELAQAQSHFFLPQRYRNAFATAAFRTDVVVRYDQHDLLVVETRDPLDNVTTAITADDDGNWALRVDYRVLQPFWITDPNGNRARVAFDVLGMVAGTAVMGKPQPAELEGDTLAGFDDELDAAQIDAFFDAADPRVPAAGLLNGATTRIIYDFDRFWHSQRAHPEDPELWQPIYTATVVRETHVRNLNGGQSKVQVNFSYSDGFGREIQKKVQAEKGPIVKGGPPVDPRWVGSGWTVYNNKGKPVRQYEPFFSTLPQRRHHFEFGVMQGVSPILFYDPVGRVIATLHPNRTYEKVVFNPWQQTTWDANDTVAPGGKQTGDPRTDPDIGGYVRPYFKVQAGDWQTWYTENSVKALGDPLRAAADKAAAHSNTPASAYLDTLGRVFLTITHNKVKCPGHALDGEEEHSCTRVELDIEGNQRSVRDAIVQSEDVAGRVVALYDYDLLGNPVRHASMEAGVRWNLNDVMGQPLWTWDGRGHTVCTEYDSLRRPIRRIVTGVDLAQPGFVRMVERMVYGEQHPGAQSLNLRGKLFLHLDQAGVLANEAYDFKNNLLQAARRLATDYRQTPSWTAVDAILPADVALQLNVDEVEAAIAALVEPHSYPSSTVYDALNRPVLLTLPSADGAPASSVRPHYNDANLLERVDANLQGAQANGQPLWTQFVNDIAYDAKGQRVFIAYANGVTTTYEYDTDTYRLTEMLTKRQPGAFPSDCSDPQPAGWAGCEVQNLHYVYDPAGNLTHVRDTAQQTIYFRNRRVEPSAEYTYDALYRLVEATGREHLGQSGSPVPSSWNDEGKTAFLSADGAGRFAPSDGNAMGAYVERYVYDAVGNFTAMQHRGSDPTNLGWTRTYVYGETSLLEDGQNGALLKWSNRLTSTSVSGNDGAAERYRYDERGNMLRLPHLGGSFPGQNLSWDYRDQLQSADMGGGGTVFYTCDAGGQRVRKVWEKTAGRVEERIYLGAIEIFRRRSGNQLLERETLHIMDDQRRVALVETRIVDDAHADPASAQLLRYQFSNHLGTATLELDEQAQIISYEEYSPYGSTVHQAVNSTTETPKRYRYTGKERDEESGLYYFGARYYAPWLGRWTACDKDTRSKDRNRYLYVRCNPLKYTDPNGMYEEPVHGATTYRLALAAGFKRDDAAKIALSTAGMDHDPGTRPGDGVLEMIKQIFLGRTKKYHFASQDKALKDVKSDIAKGTKMDLTQLGRHMHTLEDVGFKDAPGPHMRAQERLLPTLTGHIGRGLLFGGAVSLMIGGPVGVGLGIGLLLLGGLFSIFSLFAQGIGHPTYKTEKGDLSHSFSHKADEAYQDPERNAKVLTRVYSELKEAASAYYGKQVASNDAAADKAIEGVTAADTESKLRAYMDEGLDEHGNPTAEPSGKSYSQIVTEHSKRAGSEFPSPWSACDASIDDKPVLNLCVPR
jgi:RHS repeat-associated protein